MRLSERYGRYFGSFARVAVVAAAGILAGCGDDETKPPPSGGGGPTATTFTGVFANGTENGSLSITINTANLASPLPGHRRVATARALLGPSATVTASGTLKPIGGGTIALTGTYDDQADTLHLGGPLSAPYSFSGVYDTTGTFNSMIGQYDGPNGAGFFGSLTGLSIYGAYCGTFASGTTATGGNWDILVAGGEVGGIAFPTSGEPFAFEGTIETTGTMRSITAGSDDPGVFTLTITGTLNTTTNTVSGNWTYDDLVTPSTDSGTWSGPLCP